MYIIIAIIIAIVILIGYWIRSSNPLYSLTFTQKKEFTGGDYSLVESISLSAAAKLCLMNPKCVGFVFHGEPSSGKAWFKDQINPRMSTTSASGSATGLYTKN